MKELDERIERALGSAPVRYEPRAGGYSTADRFAVTLADGRSAFVKSSDEEHMAGWLRREHEVYTGLSGAFMPDLLGWDDDGIRPVLAIEDLSDADWTPHWDGARVEAVLDVLRALAGSTPPPNTAPVRETFANLFGRWREVEADPGPFLSLGLRDRAWLDNSLPTILAASEGAPVDGDALLHLDVRSDNMCFRDGRPIFVDWNWCSFGNSDVDIVAWLPSVAVEGGPAPWEILSGALGLVAWVAGVWAAVAGLPPPPTAPHVRATQRAQLAVTLDWIDRELSR